MADMESNLFTRIRLAVSGKCPRAGPMEKNFKDWGSGPWLLHGDQSWRDMPVAMEWLHGLEHSVQLPWVKRRCNHTHELHLGVMQLTWTLAPHGATAAHFLALLILVFMAPLVAFMAFMEWVVAAFMAWDLAAFIAWIFMAFMAWLFMDFIAWVFMAWTFFMAWVFFMACASCI